MRKIVEALKVARRNAPRELLRKVMRRARLWVTGSIARQMDRRRPTLARVRGDEPNVALGSFFAAPDRPHPFRSEIVEHHLAHRFDLLGSGWVEVRHGLAATGVEGHHYPPGEPVVSDRDGEWLVGRVNAANLDGARAIWSLVDADYWPIDWHLDFKSGYRWREDCWFRDIVIGPAPGVDIKVPWELARMQHLPQLALLYAEERASDKPAAHRLVREFRNEVLDFIATNPPRYGVNWACAMEVAIRSANWLVAYDIFKSAGATFDTAFEAVLASSVAAHGQHIVDNLEWINGVRGNHYLADVVGLLFCAAYLPASPRVDAWLAFAVQELRNEVQAQFHDDGGNFESSTAYHRLSTEMVVYGTALTLALTPEKRAALLRFDSALLSVNPPLLPAPLAAYRIGERDTPFPPSHWQRLQRAAELSANVTRPDGAIAQFGDNDSGRFLKLFPRYTQMTTKEARERFINLRSYRGLPDDSAYYFEEGLDHRHLVDAVAGLLCRDDSPAAGGEAAETRLVRGLAGAGLPLEVPEGVAARRRGVAQAEAADVAYGEGRPVTYAFLSTERSLRDDLDWISYPDFGLYLYRSRDLFLAIRCGPTGMNGIGPHAHNDQLSIELWIDGKPLVVDPGTYLYTPLPARRNAFRSARAHFGPHFDGEEPGDLNENIFALRDTAQARCLRFDEHMFVGRFAAGARALYRQIRIQPDGVRIVDWVEPGDRPLAALAPASFYSPGYGWLSSPPMPSAAGNDPLLQG